MGTNELKAMGVSVSRGFLPEEDPLRRLPDAFGDWEEIGQELPKLMAAGKIRSVLDQAAPLDVSRLKGEAELQRAMTILSYCGQAYVWGGAPANRLPKGLAVPWYEVSRKLGRPPVLSYPSYSLHNWWRIDKSGPVELGNIALIQNFLGGMDEEWFVVIHVQIEAQAAGALIGIVGAQEGVVKNDPSAVETNVVAMEAALDRMYKTLERMPERCDPYVYFNRVRPYLYGWKNHPALPDGVIYEGVEAYGGKGQKFRGETGAQSSIIPSLDAALGISHRDDPLKEYLLEMRDYMTPGHRAFMDAVGRGPAIRGFVEGHRQSHAALREAYNGCVRLVEMFRSKHLEYAANYIQKQNQKSNANTNDVGTGGTPFMQYLKKHRDETTDFRISA